MMKIALIGAGNVATHLGQALAKAGHQILQVYSRTEESAAALSEKVNLIYAGVQQLGPLTASGAEAPQLCENAEAQQLCESTEAPQLCENAEAQQLCESTEKTSHDATASHVKPVTTVNGENSIKNNLETRCTWTIHLDEITPTADLYLVMLKDSVLGDLLPDLVKRNPEALFVHTAGSVPMQIWEGLTKRYGVLYPMQTFSKAREVDFDQVHFFIEANTPGDATLLKNLAQQISSHVYEATSEQRKYLHLSAVFACNFTNHLYAICNELLTQHGLPFSSMFPLIDETARKIHHLNPLAAQTGPAQRNDTNVMQQQETLLRTDPALNDPAVAELYRLLSQHIVQYQQGSGSKLKK